MDTTLSDDDKKSDSEDEEEDTDTLAFNVIIDFKDTSMHNDHKDDNDDDSIYSDKEVSYEELQDKYSLFYTKWDRIVELHQNLKDNLKRIQEQKDALEERNYELMAQVKSAMEKVNMAKSFERSILACIRGLAVLQFFEDILQERRRQFMVVEIEVVSRFNAVEDFKGFKDSTVQCAKGVYTDSTRKTLDA
ncbi:hypothetical protein M9H77_17264 [Catharanthus roseus]|uniref:Uncharacterized protein n=1 Tax=Catharanthus roseus TaxID=4058 RepID=A0ACC0B421_CATRO|nr:hypothetical protein M9H77_17264 [Catharanthus roseus]